MGRLGFPSAGDSLRSPEERNGHVGEDDGALHWINSLDTSLRSKLKVVWLISDLILTLYANNKFKLVRMSLYLVMGPP